MYFSASVTGQVALVDKSAYISKTDQCLARDIVLQTVWMAPDRVSLRIDEQRWQGQMQIAGLHSGGGQ
jgi:hypothetical protein|tara:strand:+ start:4915 stop:5118 length:204 start_codon:yes stop_codon:yes gene_type:complete